MAVTPEGCTPPIDENEAQTAILIEGYIDESLKAGCRSIALPAEHQKLFHGIGLWKKYQEHGWAIKYRSFGSGGMSVLFYPQETVPVAEDATVAGIYRVEGNRPPIEGYMNTPAPQPMNPLPAAEGPPPVDTTVDEYRNVLTPPRPHFAHDAEALAREQERLHSERNPTDPTSANEGELVGVVSGDNRPNGAGAGTGPKKVQRLRG